MVIFLPIRFNMCIVCSKQSAKTVALSACNICFGCEIRKIIFKYTLQSGCLLFFLVNAYLFLHGQIVFDAHIYGVERLFDYFCWM